MSIFNHFPTHIVALENFFKFSSIWHSCLLISPSLSLISPSLQVHGVMQCHREAKASEHFLSFIFNHCNNAIPDQHKLDVDSLLSMIKKIPRLLKQWKTNCTMLQSIVQISMKIVLGHNSGLRIYVKSDRFILYLYCKDVVSKCNRVSFS